jgi:oxygen-independent coproporphyrinogen-3 oxidase
MSESELVRRNIHTYPFKYSHLQPEEFFTREPAVIYIHIPFCNTKCHFCDYTVYVNTSADLRAQYVDALCKEIADFPKNPAFPKFSIDAVYVGGGTPGVLEGHQLARILQTVRDTFRTADYLEVGVEFDPGSVTVDKLREIKAAGYNRISIGVQSFEEDILKENNRPHQLADVFTAWDAIEKVGFENSNIDLIYPLIGLDLPKYEKSLRQAISMAPVSITAYPLEVWPQTAYHHWLFKTQNRSLPSRTSEIEMCRLSFDLLEEAGYERFSTSGYFDPKRHPTYSKYLEYYWRTWPLLGFGVSSKSVINDHLYTNIRPLKEYIERVNNGVSLLDFATRMTKNQEMRRVMIRGLKMCQVSRSDFETRFGVPMELVFGKEIKTLIDQGFLEERGDLIALTREGQVFSSNAWEMFFTDDDLRAPEGKEVQFGLSELVLT